MQVMDDEGIELDFSGYSAELRERENSLEKELAQRYSSVNLRELVTSKEGAICFVDLSGLPEEVLHIKNARQCRGNANAHDRICANV